jgi:hypothetical protein
VNFGIKVPLSVTENSMDRPWSFVPSQSPSLGTTPSGVAVGVGVSVGGGGVVGVGVGCGCDETLLRLIGK